jgi:hypothetical protein
VKTVGSDGATPEEETLEGVTLPQVGQYAAPAGSCVPQVSHCIGMPPHALSTLVFNKLPDKALNFFIFAIISYFHLFSIIFTLAK